MELAILCCRFLPRYQREPLFETAGLHYELFSPNEANYCTSFVFIANCELIITRRYLKFYYIDKKLSGSVRAVGTRDPKFPRIGVS